MTDIRQALEEAYETIFGKRAIWHEQYGLFKDSIRGSQFLRFLDAEAWTDAAICLVPEGASFDLEKDHLRHGGQWHCMVGPEAEWHVTGRGVAETPAHALLAACLKAKEQADG